MYTCHMLHKQRKTISKFIVFKIVKVPHHNRQGLSIILRLTSMLKVIVRKVTITGRRGLCDVEGSWGVWTARWRQSSEPITAPGSPGGGCLGGGGGGDDWQALAIPTKCGLAFGRKNSGEHNKAQGNAGVGPPIICETVKVVTHLAIAWWRSTLDLVLPEQAEDWRTLHQVRSQLEGRHGSTSWWCSWSRRRQTHLCHRSKDPSVVVDQTFGKYSHSSKKERDQLNIFLQKDEEGDKQKTCVHRQWSRQRECPWIGKSCDLSIASSASCPESSQPPPLWRRARSNSQRFLPLRELGESAREEGEGLLESLTSFLGAFVCCYWWNTLGTGPLY